MNNPKLTNWLLATLTAVLMAVAGVGYGAITTNTTAIANAREQIAVERQARIEVQRRLDSIEGKLDMLLTEARR